MMVKFLNRRRMLLLVLVLLLSSAGLMPASSASAGGYAGEWSVIVTISCQTAAACDGVLPPWFSVFVNTMKIKSDAAGNMTFRATIDAVGREGKGIPRKCDASLFAAPFAGLCHVSDHGTGYVDASVLPGPREGLADFWVSHETAKFCRKGKCSAPAIDPFPPYPIDTGNPAVPGRYNAKTLLGLKRPGLSVQALVVQNP